MATSTSRTVFILGTETDGNREVKVVESGDTYDMDYAAISTYDDIDGRFPYTGA